MASVTEESDQIAQLKQQWEELKAVDDARYTLIDKLFTTIKKLSHDNNEIRTDVENLKFHERHYLAEVKRLTGECKVFEERLQAGSFVVVLVDGDNTLFLDDFVKKGAAGGHLAAKKLQDAVQTYAKSLLDFRSHWKVVVRIYFNMHGLVGAYVRSGTVLDPRLVQQFVIGFNRELPLFEFVDVGADKEAADNKIKENVALYWTDEHCKHVLLAGSADTSYVSFLRAYSSESKFTTKLTLVKSLPFPPSFEELASSFHSTSFEDVFRSTKLLFREQTVNASSNKHTYAVATVPNAASVARNHNATAPPPTSIAGSDKKLFRKISLNRYGQRIDQPLQFWDDKLVQRLKQRSLCARHFLSDCDGKSCSKSHKGSLTSEEKRALARVARDEPCLNGTHCYDRNCVSAHQCIHDGRCNYGPSCKYGPDMHAIDKEVTVTR